jgi:hypothetical protein
VAPVLQGEERDSADETPRLAAYMGRTRTPLDLLALATLWIVLVPPGDFGDASTFALAVRLGLSAVYGVDMTIRVVLARRFGTTCGPTPWGWSSSPSRRYASSSACA